MVMRLDRETHTYPSWALAAYKKCIAPILATLCHDGLVEKAWVDSCGPGTSDATRYRLFPGTLYLLWMRALSERTSGESARVAAALECLHNASLHHDDVLDEHDSRRGIDTIRVVAGTSGSILAGDGLFGVALRLLGTLTSHDAPKVIALLGTAWSRMNYGQLMDEASVWQKVPTENHEQHWEFMTRNKLALGNVAAPLAALSTHRDDLAEPLAIMHEEFSLVSQILNDIGDLRGWSGFHVVGPCKRHPGHEALRKPTIATVWGAAPSLRGEMRASATSAFLERAHDRVRDLTNSAIERFREIKVSASTEIILLDFFTRPIAEFEQAIGRSTAE